MIKTFLYSLFTLKLFYTACLPEQQIMTVDLYIL
jgi:hypothetical protein